MNPGGFVFAIKALKKTLYVEVKLHNLCMFGSAVAMTTGRLQWSTFRLHRFRAKEGWGGGIQKQ